MSDGSSGLRRLGFTNLWIDVVEDATDLLALDDFEEDESVSTATSLERRKAVAVALLIIRA